MTAHTPGPWEFGVQPGWVETSCGTPIACVDIGNEDARANARLIAAAPDLLTALTVSLNWIVDLVNSGDAGFWNPEDMPEVKQARAAIARATGAA